MRFLLLLTGCWLMSALLSAQTATVHKNITAVECTGPNSATVRHELDITIHNQRGENSVTGFAVARRMFTTSNSSRRLLPKETGK